MLPGMSVVQTLVRPATPADYGRFVRFFAELGTGDEPLPEARWRATAMPNTLLFERAGQVVGYSMFEILAETGYIRHLVVAPEARGRGVGQSIMQELRQRFRAHGCSHMCLNVKPDNRPAIALYERAGMLPRHRATSFQIAWSHLTQLPKSAVPLRIQTLPEADDGLFEQRFGLERGLIRRRRELPDMLVLGLREREPPCVPAGIACFDPHFPGAFPFCARDAGAARALFEALQRLVPELPGCALVIEHDDALSNTLKAVGAHVRLEVVHYRGSV